MLTCQKRYKQVSKSNAEKKYVKRKQTKYAWIYELEAANRLAVGCCLAMRSTCSCSRCKVKMCLSHATPLWLLVHRMTSFYLQWIASHFDYFDTEILMRNQNSYLSDGNRVIHLQAFCQRPFNVQAPFCVNFVIKFLFSLLSLNSSYFQSTEINQISITIWWLTKVFGIICVRTKTAWESNNQCSK